MAVTYASNVFTITTSADTAGTGTMTCAATTISVGGVAQSATSCTGAGTVFLTELRPGSFITVSGAGLVVHSIQSNTALLAFKSDNATGTHVVGAPSTFTHRPPTTFADLKTAVDAQAATIAQCVGTSFNFTAASVTTQGGAVLFLDDYTALSFGSAGAYRFNLSGGSHLCFRSGGGIAYHGNVQHSFFGGFISVYAGELTYQCKNPGANARQDFFAGGTSSNGISAMTLIYAGGTAGTTWAIYTHLENLVGKIAALKIVNAITATAASGNGPYIQFGSGAYRDVAFPSPLSTSGITQNFAIYLARSGGTTTLVNPVLRGSTFIPASDAGSGIANLIDEIWPDLPAGSVGTFTYTGGNTDINRIFSYYPGTLYQSSNPVFLGILNKNGVAAVNGAITSAAAIPLTWQTISKTGGVKTDLFPFSLTARRKDVVEVTSTFTPVAPITYNNPLAADASYTTDASAQTGITVTAGTKTVSIGAGTGVTIDRRYDYLKYWLSQNLAVTNFLNPSGSVLAYLASWNDSVAGTSTAGTKLTSTTTAGAVAVQSGGSVTHAYEDVAGVRVTVRKSGGGNFNIAARKGTTGAYTDLGFQSNVASVTYTVPKGTPVEVVMWSLGCVTYSRTISTANGGLVFDAEMIVNTAINTSLDVSSYLAGITLSLDTSGATPYFVITFNSAITVPGIELGKAVIHQLVGQEVPLRAGLPPNSTSTVAIASDEITNNLPALRLAIGAGLAVTDRVYLDFFINQSPALALNPAYVINTPRADGNQVQILRAKPTLDPSVLAAAVLQSVERTGGMLDNKASQTSVTALGAPAQATALTALVDANQAEHDATQTAIAEIPAAPTPPASAAVAAAVRTELATELARIDVPTSTRSTLTTAQIPAGLTAGQVRTELAPELARIDVPVGTRLAESAYIAPDNATVVAIKAKSDTLVNAPTLQQIEASMQSAITSIPAAPVPPTPSQIRVELETVDGKLDRAMRFSKAAKRQTL